MPRDLGMMEDDMGSIEDKRGQLRRPTGTMPRRNMERAMAPKRPMARHADGDVYTAAMGNPPSPDDMGSIENKVGQLRPQGGRQMKAAQDIRSAMGMKKGGCVKKMSSGGKVGSASKRADGCAVKGKTKGKMV